MEKSYSKCICKHSYAKNTSPRCSIRYIEYRKRVKFIRKEFEKKNFETVIIKSIHESV